MLKHLSIKDFVIVDRIELDFMPGFTVLTGETGAGKSILIDAVTLALGERSDASQIRHGCERAEINVTFDISRLPGLQQWLDDNDLQGDPDSCLMRRIIETSGRSRSYINGHAVTLQQLRTAGEYLVAIHSQHAHQSLLQKDAQRELLDAFAGCMDQTRAVRMAYQHWQDCYQQRIAREQRTAESQEKREQLEWQLQELTALNFTLPEWQTLQADHGRLSHVAALLAAADTAVDVLSESEQAVLAQINSVNNQLQNLLEYDNELKAITDLLDAAQIQLQESVYELKHYRQRLDLDPQVLQEIEQRLSAIHAAARKFRVLPEELPSLLETISQQLSLLGSDEDIGHLQALEAAAHTDYLQQAQALSVARQKASEALSQQVSDAMQTMAMAGGEFSVALIPMEQGNAHGLEQIEFRVAAHKGLPLRPLAKVASGGELSRISLAIQVITSKVGTVSALIFDEVDVGIGGKVAEIVGYLLKKLGRERQVLCITHLPQVAATGDHQWQVEKSAGQAAHQPVISTITILDQQQRVEEIARMLGGVSITETTRQHAAEMLQQHAQPL
ncbi:DNA repair protein RecN [Nitrosomonas oligotropha]|uniref:DNA repair protein RecN n=1 Tax=Nitrosomonas oligotropha TaxID=42354 RepID=A0A1H8SYL2_9PROT|nr:DNA repair protein RecN [Nitrosomonas oligotropha]SDX19453.1 DNA replication and repair protein RecN [Nitrosomonas oligotropha]SEO83717.1 DNA replication and repair protein RecN [Nitrosomonas oligotropha]